MNEYLLDKINNQEKYKRDDIETDSKTTSYKLKGKKEKSLDSESSSDIKTRSHRERHRYTSENSESDRKPGRK